MTTILKMKNPSKILNKLATQPMTKWELKQTLDIHYSRAFEAISLLEKEGYVKSLQKPASKRGKNMNLYGLTFKGTFAYLTLIAIQEQNESGNNTEPEDNQPNKIIHEPPSISPLQKHESMEAYNQRKEKEIEKYHHELDKIEVFLETYGKILNYPIFSEIRWLKEKYGYEIFKNIITIAKIITDLKPFPTSGMRLINNSQKLKKQILVSIEVLKQKNIEDFGYLIEDLKETEETIRILRLEENKWWSMAFAARFANQFSENKGEGDMHNEALQGFFAQVAEYYRRLEVEPSEKMTQIFSETTS